VTAREGAFALANEGTIFLDEIGELSLGLQVNCCECSGAYVQAVGSNTVDADKLPFDLCDNRDLQKEEAQGNFRRDFYHRIASWTIRLPACVSD
jgi:transcriptional regulator with GAF, ATPase, and Fis domain